MLKSEQNQNKSVPSSRNPRQAPMTPYYGQPHFNPNYIDLKERTDSVGRQAVPMGKGQNFDFSTCRPQFSCEDVSDHNPATEAKQLSRSGARKELGTHGAKSDNCMAPSPSRVIPPSSISNTTQNSHSCSRTDSRQNMENMISKVSQLISLHNEKSFSSAPNTISAYIMKTKQTERPKTSSQEKPPSSCQKPEVVATGTMRPSPSLVPFQKVQIPPRCNLCNTIRVMRLLQSPPHWDPVIKELSEGDGFMGVIWGN